MNIKHSGMNVLGTTPRSGQNSVLRSHRLGTPVPNGQRNGLVPSLCFRVVHKHEVRPAVMLEAEYAKLAAVAEWRTYGFKPERFSVRSGTLHL